MKIFQTQVETTSGFIWVTENLEIHRIYYKFPGQESLRI